MKHRNYALILTPLILMAGICAGLIIGSKMGSGGRMSDTQKKIETILGLIDSEYVDSISVDSLLEMSIPDMLSYLDPHSVYVPASELSAVNEDLEGSFSGVGVSFQVLNDTVVVVEVISNGPAEKAGLKPGDRIIKSGKTNLAGVGVTNDDVFKNLRGTKGSKVKLKIMRPGASSPFSLDVVRDEVPVTSVDASYMANDKVGYVKVSKFARNTYKEFMDAVRNLREKGARQLIVDLRANAGGLMDQAIMMANEFLPKDRMIVYTKARTSDNQFQARSYGDGTLQDTELIVLVNEYSASASEIFAGAIQDNDRGLVIGRRTFGKGLVQNQIMLPDSSAIRLTVARYYTPSGRSIQKEYKRGQDGKYDEDLVDRYTHGEFYSADSIKLDKTKKYRTVGGRTVYGGGGIMPDIFVAEDTTQYTSYYFDAMNNGIIQKYSFKVADNYRSFLRGVKLLNDLLLKIPRDEILLTNFVDFAEQNGQPSAWYYINQSRPLLLNQIKAVIARDILGFGSYIQVLNSNDPTVLKALEIFEKGGSPVVIPAKKTSAKK